MAGTISGLAGRRALTRLRCGTNELRINTGRWESLPVALRLCPVCGLGVETESHFLLDCAFNAERRAALFNAIDAVMLVAQALQPSAAAAAAFHSAELPPAERMALLTGGSHPAVTAAGAGMQVLSRILVALAEWTTARKERLALIAQLQQQSR